MEEGDRELGSISLQPATSSNIAKDAVSSASQADSSSSGFRQAAAEQATQQESARVSQGVAQAAAQQAASAIGGVLRSGADEVRLYVQSNPYSVTLLSFIGGTVLMVISFLGLFNIFSIMTGPLSYLLQMYQILFGFLICTIDGPVCSRMPNLREKVLQHASFLASNNSRAAFYLFIACFEGTQSNFWHELIGWYFVVIAAMYVALHFLNSPAGARDIRQPLSGP
jgi:hypothetical protein